MIIESDVRSVHLEDLIAEELNAVTISHNGYIKRLPLTTYRAQHRGGRGVSGGDTREDDFVEHFFITSTHAYLLCFTNKGQLYWLKVLEIPQMSRTSAGRNIANLLSLREDEKISSIIPVRRFTEDAYLMMATKAGVVKKTALDDYSRPRAGGIIGIALDEGDSLIGVVQTHAGDEIVLATKQGMAIRFDENQARAMGRNTRGVKGISLAEGDEVVGMVVADPQGALFTVCEKGYGKRTPSAPTSPAPRKRPTRRPRRNRPPTNPSRMRKPHASAAACATASKSAAARACATSARATATAPSSACCRSTTATTSCSLRPPAWSTAPTSAKSASSAATRRGCAS